MEGPIGYASVGEAAVADYLHRRSIPFDYEPSLGGRHPDFLGHHPDVGDVVLEVYEPELRLLGTVGSYDGVAPLYGAFSDRKRKQAKAARNEGLPFVVVVGSSNSDIAFDWFSAVGALRGRPGVAFQVGTGEVNREAKPTLIGAGKTAGGENTSVSAIGLVDRFNPTLWRLELAWRALSRTSQAGLPGERDARVRHLAQIFEIRQRIADDLTERGLFRPDLSRVKLQLFHNPDAAISLPRTFAGAHDEQWDAVDLDDGTVGYGQVSLGRLAWEWLPRGDMR